jgi:hypothetical protein
VERLREHPELPLLLLHDASPQGCLLPYTIRKSLRLLAYHNVVDVGLHPSDAIEHKLLRLGASPSQRALTYLKKRVDQGGQKQTRGAGGGSARPLSQEEFKWLEKGYYAPLLFIPPARLIKVLVRTLQRLNLATPATMNMNMNMSVSKAALPADPEERAQVEAQAVGFMSWPTV